MTQASLASPCGLYCGPCEYLGQECKGCIAIEGKPFWTAHMDVKVCPLYDCCVNKKQFEHCGMCDELPCETFSNFYDPALGPEEGKISVLARENDLMRRKEIGTERWVAEKEAVQ